MTTAIPVLPQYPQRGTPSDNYIPLADNWAAALSPFGVALNQLGQQVETLAVNTANNATLASDRAAAAAASAARAEQAAVNAVLSPGSSGTSTTSMAISAGAKSFTTQTGKGFSVGQFVTVAYTADPGNYMLAQVQTYDSTTGAMTVNSVAVLGSGTYTAWTIGLSAPYINPSDDFVALSTLSFLLSA